jgi:hypothetical protein
MGLLHSHATKKQPRPHQHGPRSNARTLLFQCPGHDLWRDGAAACTNMKLAHSFNKVNY